MKAFIIFCVLISQAIFAQDTLYVGVKGEEKLTLEEAKKITDNVVLQINKQFKDQKTQYYSSLEVRKIEQVEGITILRVKPSYGNIPPDPYVDFSFVKNPISFKNKVLKDLNNSTVEMNKFQGKPTLINFWFTRCAPCIDEMPILKKLMEKYKDQVNFIAVTFEDQAKVKQFLENNEFHFLHFIDAKKLTDELNIQGYPSNFILDKDLNVVAIEGGIPYMKDENGGMKIGEATEIEHTLKSLLP